MARRVLALVVTLLLASNPAAAGGMGLFSDPDGTTCIITLEPVVPARIYVLYLGQGSPAATGAEYKIDGMPGTFGVDFIATLINAPGSGLNLGNAFDGTGHQVAWPAPQPFDGNGNLLVASYQMVEITPTPPALLRVTQLTPAVERVLPVPVDHRRRLQSDLPRWRQHAGRQRRDLHRRRRAADLDKRPPAVLVVRGAAGCVKESWVRTQSGIQARSLVRAFSISRMNVA